LIALVDMRTSTVLLCALVATVMTALVAPTAAAAHKDATFPACTTGDMACTPAQRKNTVCCPDGGKMRMQGGISEATCSGPKKCKGVKPTAPKPASTAASATKPGSSASLQPDSDTAPVPANQFAACLTGDSACAKESYPGKYCCPFGVKYTINLDSGKLSGRKYNSVGCPITPGKKCNGDSTNPDPVKVAATADAVAAAQATKAAADPKLQAKAAADAAAKIASAKAAVEAAAPAPAKRTATGNQRSSATSSAVDALPFLAAATASLLAAALL